MLHRPPETDVAELLTTGSELHRGRRAAPATVVGISADNDGTMLLG